MWIRQDLRVIAQGKHATEALAKQQDRVPALSHRAEWDERANDSRVLGHTVLDEPKEVCGEDHERECEADADHGRGDGKRDERVMAGDVEQGEGEDPARGRGDDECDDWKEPHGRHSTECVVLSGFPGRECEHTID